MAFDLKKNNLAEQSETGYEFELVYPATGEAVDAFITVRGNESKVVKNFLRKRFNENQVLVKKGKKKDDSITIEEFLDNQIELAVVKTIGWRGIQVDGVDLPFTQENAEKIYREHEWIREAVEKESAEIENFRSGGA